MTPVILATGDALPAGKGGAIHVMVRIQGNGHIQKACAETDDLGDESVRACVMDAVRKTKLPAPDQPIKPLCE